jgi:hypothetical protein
LTITVGTDCSGLEAPLFALRQMGARFVHLFSSEKCTVVQDVLKANFSPKRLYGDLTLRDPCDPPKVDLYVAGFPCQPFSAQGLREGFNDLRGRGGIFFHLFNYIRLKRPCIFVLENVPGLVTLAGGSVFAEIMAALRSIGAYRVFWDKLNPEDYGVPQHRPRVFIVGILKTCYARKFHWPRPCRRRASLENFLLPRRGTPCKTSLPPVTSTTARDNVAQALADLDGRGLHPLRDCFVVNCCSTPERCHVTFDRSFCLTSSRPSGFWLTNRGRFMHLVELLRLQGFEPQELRVPEHISSHALGQMVGNSMCVSVLVPLFVELFRAVRCRKYHHIASKS